jgi:cellulose synthase/poly-beta-1,6-N-acetylglucosamine synthase-like glycosyltransferase
MLGTDTALLVRFVNGFALLWLSLYGLQALLLTLLYLRHRREVAPGLEPGADEWPRVVVQLPVYNEQHVVERLIDAAAALDYPATRLEIQVLDDSTDETTAIAETRAAYHRARGLNIAVLRRPTREGYKAGALARGLQQTDAEFVVVFDADFRPRPDFLRRTIPRLLANPGVGVAQTRWSHLNDVYSLLTRLQALALDGHFVVEQTGRNRSGLLINFNGSGGVWRRACIEAAGGWQWDTMTEDMDLSYRAQLAGWRSLYLLDVDAPAELPPQIDALKRQQARWAQGSTQCLRKLTLPILRSQLTCVQKFMALLHISSYFTQPVMILILLTTLPMLLLGQPTSRLIAGLWVVGMGPPLLYLAAESALYRNWGQRLLCLPLLAALVTGIAWSTSQAVCQGLVRWGGTFRRTPKFRLEGVGGQWVGSIYRLVPDWTVAGELLLMIYAAVTIAVAWSHGRYSAIPFLLLYLTGFALVAGSSLWQGFRRA